MRTPKISSEAMRCNARVAFVLGAESPRVAQIGKAPGLRIWVRKPPARRFYFRELGGKEPEADNDS